MQHEEEFITSSDSTILSSVSTSDERMGYRRNMSTQFEYDSESFESTKINFLNTRIKKLMNIIATTSVMLLELQNENCVLKKQVESSQKVKEFHGVVINEKVLSLINVIKDKDQHVKELWNFAKTLNEENMALRYKADLWDQREKRVKWVKNDSMNMSFANASALPEFRITNISSNWKNKLDQEVFHKMSDEENALAYKVWSQEQREKWVNRDIMNKEKNG